MLNDPLANVLSNIVNAIRSGKTTCQAEPSSQLIIKVLEIMHTNGYIGGYEVKENGRGGVIVVSLAGSLNRCAAIKPRFPVKKDNYEKFEKRFLPAKDFGLLIVSTPQGIMTHTQSKEKNLGGKLIAYVY